MRTGGFRGDVFQISNRRIAEWSARRGKQNATHAALTEATSKICRQGLENGIVFAVDRQQRRAMRLDRRQHDLPRADQRLLIGQRHGFALFDGRHSGGGQGRETGGNLAGA